MPPGLPLTPLVVGAVVVSAALTAFGFTVYGEELSGATVVGPTGHVLAHPTRRPVPVRPTAEPLGVSGSPALPASLAPSAESVRQNVASLFAANGVKGITFAPGGTEHAGRGAEVQRGVGDLLAGTSGAAVALVAHAWQGETPDHRLADLAQRRAELVRDSLVARGVPAEVISTRVVVDAVWGAPSESGPQVDVLVG
ncbi:hypothetical protein [Saccharothrix australiensis]|uniref:Outer membrane protein OmpA-like peptidoglycan-associated protein n=1 Tax=Saccharothrix australiensis TaxID=2072 RepID=A0A495W6U1_9PSEU|nr:hypothetical protein [Saccharothrix australiensis]RKT57189.1 outer membrane protein OmpA-like peptidoglycan-associated protein [Saccharothrix australiensis]